MDHKQSKPRSNRRTWWLLFRYLAIGVGFFLLLSIGFLLILRAYFIHVANKQLEAAMAELDRTDPGWRWEDILKKREVIPDHENGALRVLAAKKWIPDDWPVTGPRKRGKQLDEGDYVSLLDRLKELEPTRALDEELLVDLRADLTRLEQALEEARSLACLAKGRYDVTWNRNLMVTLLPHLMHARQTAVLLQFDAAVRAHDGDMDGALLSSRAALNAGRSIGDDPTMISQFVRFALARSTVENVQRVLAQGQASLQTLEATQQLLEDETAQPLLRLGLRSERAAYDVLLERVYLGQVHFDELVDARDLEPSWPVRFRDWLYVRPGIHWGRATCLEHTTSLLGIIDLPAEEREQQLDEFNQHLKSLKTAGPQYASTYLLVSGLPKAVDTYHESLAAMRSTIVALAAERYRLAHKRWPDSLDQLAPEFLDKLPDDPFANEPLCLRRLEDGIVIYSVGKDRTDNGGLLDRQKPLRDGVDIGFRLWDADKRRQPAATNH